MVGSHQEFTTRVKGKSVRVLLVVADEIKTPFRKERDLCSHASSRNIDQRCVIMFEAARYHKGSAVGTEGLLIEKTCIEAGDRMLLQCFEIQ